MRIIASGLRFPEGPVWTSDGSVLLVEIERKTLTRVCPDGRVEVVAQMDGGPNGAAVGPDGQIYITNNGGFGWIREGNTLRTGLQPPDYQGGSIDVVDPKTGRSSGSTTAATVDGLSVRTTWCSIRMAVFGSPISASAARVIWTSAGLLRESRRKRHPRGCKRHGDRQWVGLSPDGKILMWLRPCPGVYGPSRSSARRTAQGALALALRRLARRRAAWRNAARQSRGFRIRRYLRGALTACAVVEISPDGDRIVTTPRPI